MGEARRKRLLQKPFPPPVHLYREGDNPSLHTVSECRCNPNRYTVAGVEHVGHNMLRDQEFDRIHARIEERRASRVAGDAERDHRAQPARHRSRLSAIAMLGLMGALTAPMPPLRDFEHEP